MKRFILFVFVFCFVVIPLFASVPDQGLQNRPFHVIEVQVSPAGDVITLQLDRPEVMVGGGREEAVRYLEYDGMAGLIFRPGQPVVPTTGGLVRLPAQGDVSLEVLDSHFNTSQMADYALFNGEENPETFARLSLHPSQQWFPEEVATLSEPMIMRDFRVAQLQINPVQVNLATGEVRIVDRLQIRINQDGGYAGNELDDEPQRISEAFLPFYRQFLNWDENELDEFEIVRGSVQILMPFSPILLGELEPWLEWKRQKGWTLEYLTDQDVEEWTQENIIQELQNRWNESDTKFDYVIVIGDDTGPIITPAGSGEGLGSGDHGYGLMEGEDDLLDAIPSRISVNSLEDVQTYVNKVLAYERDVDPDHNEWYLRGAVAATANFSSIFVGRFCRYAMLNLGYTQVDTAWFNDGLGAVVPRAIQYINNGVSYYNCRGNHGMGLQTNDILEDLTNTNQTPFVVDLASSSGEWALGLGVVEAYIRAQQDGLPTGGIGAIGRATSMSTRFNNAAAGGIATSVLIDRNPTMGQAVLAGKMNIWNNFYQMDPTHALENNITLIMIGDPTVWLWTDAPHELAVAANPTYTIGSNIYSVSVTENDAPVAGAWVTLYWVEDDIPFTSTGVTAPDGTCTLEVNATLATDAVLTVTCQNCAPVQMDVEFVMPDAGIRLESIGIVDSGVQGTEGNGNGIAEAGETVGLLITAVNLGEDQLRGFQAEGEENDPFITTITGAAQFGTLLPGVPVTATELILAEISPLVRDNWRAEVSIVFTDQQRQFNSFATFPVHAMRIAPGEIFFRDGLEPGAVDSVAFGLLNIGGGAAAAGTVTVTTEDPYLTILTDETMVNEIQAGQSGITGYVAMQASMNAIVGYQAPCTLILETEDGGVDTIHTTVPIGRREMTDPSGPDQYGYYALDDADQAYDLAPVSDWVEINSHRPFFHYTGESLNLGDDGEDQDTAALVDLPFIFQYYGQTYNQITVSANGYIAMGNQVDMCIPRNWTIPSPLGPNAMIAPYWDDRLSGINDADVLVYYDEPRNRFIIEWYRVPDLNEQNPCTFEIVLFDQAGGHITHTGDNEILFQYDQMHHSPGALFDVPFFTTGIENPWQNGGLQYEYWLQAGPCATPVQSGRSILFTTRIPTSPYSFALTLPQDESVIQTVGPVMVQWTPLQYDGMGDLQYHVQWSTQPDFETAYEDVTTETFFQITGFGDGHPFIAGNTVYWRVWAVDENGLETRGTPHQGQSFTLADQGQQVIPLQARYFELVSLNRVPPNLDAEQVFGGIDALQIVYQSDGGIFLPPDINTIHDISVAQGYQIFCDQASQLTVDGTTLPSGTIYDMRAGIWNWLGYPFDFDLPAQQALTDMGTSMVIIQNDDGLFWIPGVINTLGSLHSGEAYYTFVLRNVQFRYNVGYRAVPPLPEDEFIEDTFQEFPGAMTGKPYVILVEMTPDLLSYNPAVVEIHDGNELVGRAVVPDDRELFPVICWQGDSDYALPGFTPGNPITVKVLGSDGEEVIPLRIDGNSHTFGEAPFSRLYLNADPLPSTFSVGRAWPNPFNPSTIIPFSLPTDGEVEVTLFNTLGQALFSERLHFTAGNHQYEFNSMKLGSRPVSGMYFCSFQFEGEVRNTKILLLK